MAAVKLQGPCHYSSYYRESDDAFELSEGSVKAERRRRGNCVDFITDAQKVDRGGNEDKDRQSGGTRPKQHAEGGVPRYRNSAGCNPAPGLTALRSSTFVAVRSLNRVIVSRCARSTPREERCSKPGRSTFRCSCGRRQSRLSLRQPYARE